MWQAASKWRLTKMSDRFKASFLTCRTALGDASATQDIQGNNGKLRAHT